VTKTAFAAASPPDEARLHDENGEAPRRELFSVTKTASQRLRRRMWGEARRRELFTRD